MKNLIWLLTRLLRLHRQEFDFSDGIFKGGQGGGTHSQMRDDNPIIQNLVAYRGKPHGFQCNIGYSGMESAIRDDIKINEGSVGARNCRNLSLDTGNKLDWRLTQAFTGHDGIPRFWHPASDSWQPWEIAKNR